MNTKIIIAILFLSFFSPKKNIVINDILELKSKKSLIGKFGKIYSIKGNSLTIITQKGDTVSSYFSPYGNIANIDISDPFKIFIKINNHNKIIITDNFLTELSSKIELENYNIYNNFLFCRTSENGLWIFDKDNHILLKLNNKFELETSKELSPVLYENITSIKASNSMLFLNSKNKKIIILDRSMNLVKEISAQINSDFFISKNTISYLNSEKNKIKFIDFESQKKDSISINDSLNTKNIFIDNDNILISNDSKIFIGKISFQ